MIVTPYGHVLYTKMLQIARQFVSTILCNWGLRVFFCACARNDVQPFTSRSSSMQSKKIMESSEDIFSCRNCSLPSQSKFLSIPSVPQTAATRCRGVKLLIRSFTHYIPIYSSTLPPKFSLKFTFKDKLVKLDSAIFN